MTFILYIYLAIYILILIGISYFISKRQKKEGFLIAGRNRKGWQIMLSKVAAGIGAGYFITYTGFAYEYGLGVFAMLFGVAIGYLVYAYWAAPKIQKNSKENRFYTIGDYVYSKTKSYAARTFADIVSSLIMFSWLLTGIIGGGKIVSDFGLISYDLAVLITVGVILIYILMAGYKAVLMTDVVQAVVIFVLLLLVTVGVVGSNSVGSILAVETGTVNLGVILSFLVFGIFSVFSYADRFQLVYASKTRKGLIHGMGFAIIPLLLAMGLLLLIGMFMASETSGLDSGLIFTEALKNFLPASLLPFGIVLFFAGIMSSADTNVYGIASHYAMHKKGEKVKIVRMSTVILLLVVSGLAVIFPNVVDASIFAGALSMTLSFSIIYLLFNKNKTKKFLASGIGGLIGLVLGIIFLGFDPTIALPALLGGVPGLVIPFKKK